MLTGHSTGIVRASPGAQESIRILYVEDNPSDVNLVRRYLSLHAQHFSVHAVASRREAMDQIMGQPLPLYDVVITDLHLERDGLLLLNSIREQALPIAVVVITYPGNEEEVVAALKAGADDYLVRRNDYLERLPLTLESALYRFRARRARQADPLKVLYAEHNSLDIELTREHFKHHAPHIHLDVVMTVSEALRRLPQKGGASPYDLMLLNYRLPGIGALEVLKELRQDRGLDTPVVLVAGQGDEEEALQALKLGATSYIVKNPGYLHQLPGELENADHKAELLRERIALRESEERFRLLANTAPVMIWVSGPDKLCTWFNQNWLDFTGRSIEQEMGNGWAEGVHPDDFNRCLQIYVTAFDARLPFSMEYRLRRHDGEWCWILDNGAPSYGAKHQFTGYLGSCIDVTERKALEQELQRREREFSTLVENSPDVIARLDLNLRYIYISPGLERVTNISPDQFIGKTPRQTPLKDYDWQRFETSCREAINEKKTVHLADDYGGRNYWKRVIPEFSPDGEVESLITISEDVTDRVRAEKELMQLTAQLFRLQDEERRRIARELHDGTAQNLFGISINLAKLNQLSSEQTEAKKLIEECESLGNQTLQEIRTLSYLLHPPLLDEAGLVSALRWYVEGFSKRSGIFVDVLAQPIDRLSPDIELALFRVVQESLTNVLRHSGSETASIRLDIKSDEISLEIQDRGRGLHAPKHSEDSGGSEEFTQMGVGIPGMQQRLSQLGGRLRIDSNNQGTTITAVVPMMNGATYGANPSRGRP